MASIKNRSMVGRRRILPGCVNSQTRVLNKTRSVKPLKVAIIVLATDQFGYDVLIQTIKETWGQNRECDVYFNYGRRKGHEKLEEGRVILKGHDIICGHDDGNTPSLYEDVVKIACNKKTASALKFIHNKFDYDYIYRCCAGSYIHQGRLLKFLRPQPRRRFYCGRLGKERIIFASGSGYFLSKDLLGLVASKNEQLLRHGLQSTICGPKTIVIPDDLAMGSFMQQHGVRVLPAPRIDGQIMDKPGNYHWHYRTEPDKLRKIHRLLKGKH
jgi:hypothetical protein